MTTNKKLFDDAIASFHTIRDKAISKMDDLQKAFYDDRPSDLTKLGSFTTETVATTFNLMKMLGKIPRDSELFDSVRKAAFEADVATVIAGSGNTLTQNSH